MSKKKYTKAEMKEYARELFKQNISEFAEETYQRFLNRVPLSIKELAEQIEANTIEIKQVLYLDEAEAQDLFELAYEYLETHVGHVTDTKIKLMKEIKGFGEEVNLVVSEEPMVTMLFDDGIVIHVPADEQQDYTAHMEITSDTTIADIRDYVYTECFNTALENLKN